MRDQKSLLSATSARMKTLMDASGFGSGIPFFVMKRVYRDQKLIAKGGSSEIFTAWSTARGETISLKKVKVKRKRKQITFRWNRSSSQNPDQNLPSRNIKILYVVKLLLFYLLL
mmetsp:Transcript_14695/g.16660  ORF Transcript_14695/g.16660 Transcript_14695/m.16660 type:complete len:114 (-) Transcript_14695:381-722(-)